VSLVIFASLGNGTLVYGSISNSWHRVDKWHRWSC